MHVRITSKIFVISKQLVVRQIRNQNFVFRHVTVYSSTGLCFENKWIGNKYIRNLPKFIPEQLV